MRFVICSRFCQEKDIHFAWNEISEQATEVLKSSKSALQIINKETETMTKDKGEMVARFGSHKLESEKNVQKMA